MKAAGLRTLLAGLLLLPMAAAAAPSVDELNRRLTIVENKLSSDALTDLVNELRQLRESVDELRGDVAIMGRRLDSLAERQRRMYASLDERLRALETAPRSTSDATPNTRDAARTNRRDATAAGKALYERAFATLRAGDYDEARKELRAVLHRYPNGRFADNARYWLAESYYVVRAFDKAQAHFERVIRDYPDSAKRPHALLKLGFIHHERGELDRARKALRRLIARFPDTAAANRAAQRLERIRA